MVGIESLDGIQHSCGLQDGVQGVEELASCGPIEEEGVHVEVCDIVSEGHHNNLVRGHRQTFSTASSGTDIVSVRPS